MISSLEIDFHRKSSHLSLLFEYFQYSQEKKHMSSSSSSVESLKMEKSSTRTDFMVESPDQVSLRKSANKFFKNKKRRRASSECKKFVCDHIGLTEIHEIDDILSDHNDEGILFSDRTSRLSNRSHMSECVCIVSSNYIYILNSRLEFEENMEAIPIASIQKLATSKVSDNAVVIFLDNFNSQLLMTPYKIELMMVLKNQYKNITDKNLEIVFSNEIDFSVNSGTIFEINFIETKDGVKMSLYSKANPE